MSDCLFCKILKKEIPSTKVYEDDKVYGFVDIFPQAKKHFLLIHKEHTKNVSEMPLDQINDVFKAIKVFTNDSGLAGEGFRVVTNNGELSGQTVFHAHFHVLSGEKLRGFGA